MITVKIDKKKESDMKILEIDKNTEGTFFRCLHDEKPENPKIIKIRREWYNAYKRKGLKAKVLIDDEKRVVGLCQYLPIEHSPFEGKDLLAILCIWVHGYEHHIGNQQKQGYGRLILEHIENDARESGMKGVAVWGKDFPYWNPISFYEHMGYKRVDNEGINILAWKSFDKTAIAPTIRRRPNPSSTSNAKVDVTAFRCSWCYGGLEYCQVTQDAINDVADIVDFSLVDDFDSPSICDTIFINGKPFRPDGPPFTEKELQDEVIKQYEKRKK